MNFDYSDVREYKLYPALVTPLNLLSRIVYESECYGKENVPLEGALIIACNHVAFSDPALIVANCPRKVHYMAKNDLFRNPAFALLFRHMNAFPVKRWTSDRQALRYAKAVLDNGWALGIFPEGRRVRETEAPTEARSGVGYLARITGADILPCCIYKEKRHFRSRAVVRFGTVIKNSTLGFKGENKQAETRKASELIMYEIKKLWEEEKCRS